MQQHRARFGRIDVDRIKLLNHHQCVCLVRAYQAPSVTDERPVRPEIGANIFV